MTSRKRNFIWSRVLPENFFRTTKSVTNSPTNVSNSSRSLPKKTDSFFQFHQQLTHLTILIHVRSRSTSSRNNLTNPFSSYQSSLRNLPFKRQKWTHHEEPVICSKTIPTDWKRSHILRWLIGECIAKSLIELQLTFQKILRKQFDREMNEWLFDFTLRRRILIGISHCK